MQGKTAYPRFYGLFALLRFRPWMPVTSTGMTAEFKPDSSVLDPGIHLLAFDRCEDGWPGLGPTMTTFFGETYFQLKS